jgi:hypothetical protein
MIWLKWFSWGDIFPDLLWKMPFSTLLDKVSWLDETKKMLLLRSFYSELWLVWNVLGQVSRLWASWLIASFEKWSIIAGNLKSWEALFKWFTTEPVEQLKKILETISHWEWKWLEKIQEALNEAKRSYEIIEKMKALPKGDPKLNALLDELWRIEAKIAGIKWEFWFDGVSPKKGWIKWIKGAFRNPIQYSYMTNTLKEISSIVKGNSELWVAIKNGKYLALTERFNYFKEQFRLRQIWWNTVFHIANVNEAKSLSLALKDLTPWIARTLFWRLPIILIWKTMFDEAVNWKWSWLQSLYVINGFAGWRMLINEAYVSIEDWKIDLKNAWVWALWAFVIWTEIWLFGKDLVKYWARWRYVRALLMALWNSVVRIPFAAIETGAWWIAKLNWVVRLISKMPKKWKIWLLAALVAWVLVYTGFSWDNVEKELEENWFVKDWELNLKAIREKWSNLWEKEQEDILKISFITSLPEQFKKDAGKFDLKLENWIFVIWVKKEFLAQNWWIIEKSKFDLSRVLYELDSDYIVEVKEI